MTTQTWETPAQEWQDLGDAIVSGIRQIILYGPPGTGKTFSGLHYNNAGQFDLKHHAHRVTCNEDMTAADVTGHMMPGPDGFTWNNGAVLNAWIDGGRVVADEIDRASGDVLSLLLAMFDSPESASWTHPFTGEVFRPKEGFSVIMTTNVEDMDELPTALKDRFPVAIRIAHPHPSALLALSPDLRQAASNSADAPGYRRISLRTWKAFDTMRKSVADERAAEIIFKHMASDVLDAIKINAVTA